MAEHLEHKEEGIKEFPVPVDNNSLYINYHWCKGCSICVEFCPKDVFDYSVIGQPVVTRPESCNLCMICVHRCPDFSIAVGASGQILPERKKTPVLNHVDKGGKKEEWVRYPWW